MLYGRNSHTTIHLCHIFAAVELTSPSELSLDEGADGSVTFCLTVTEPVENFTLYRQFSIDSFTVSGGEAKGMKTVGRIGPT